MHHPSKIVNFPSQPDVLDLGNRKKQLHSPYRFEWFQNGRRVRLTVPEGFVYNGASVPSFVWSIYPPHALDRASVFHDFIYRDNGFMPLGAHQYYDESTEKWVDITKVWTRSAADSLFKKHLAQDPKGPGWLRRNLAYSMVRSFGKSYWGR